MQISDTVNGMAYFGFLVWFVREYGITVVEENKFRGTNLYKWPSHDVTHGPQPPHLAYISLTSHVTSELTPDPGNSEPSGAKSCLGSSA